MTFERYLSVQKQITHVKWDCYTNKLKKEHDGDAEEIIQDTNATNS